MLDIQFDSRAADLVRDALRKRQMDPGAVDVVAELDLQRRGLIGQVEALKAERNVVSKRDWQDESGPKSARPKSSRCGWWANKSQRWITKCARSMRPCSSR